MTDWVTISAEDYMKLIAYVNSEERGELVRVVRGRWEHIEQIDGHAMGECSNCHKVRITDNYCPNCGADMREVDDED